MKIDWDAYCAIDRMNVSTLVHGLKSMKRLKRAIDKKITYASNAMVFGVGVHCLLLEPEEFGSRFTVMPSFHLDPENLREPKRKDEPIEDRQTTSKATKYYTSMVKRFEEENSDKTILTREEYEDALTCMKAIHARTEWAEDIEACEREVTLLGEIDGVECKGRLDLLSSDYIIDLKTTNEVQYFDRTFNQLEYAFKLAFYRELVRQNTGSTINVAVIAQETSGDFDNAWFAVPCEVLDVAFLRVREVIANYKTSLETGVWPGWDGGQERVEIAVPYWSAELNFAETNEVVF